METVKHFLHPSLIWFVGGFIILMIEFAGPSLIIFFFALRAWIVSILCSFLPISLNMQLLIFVVWSLSSLLLLRSHLQNVFNGRTKSKHDLNKDIDDFIGEKAKSIQAFSAGPFRKVAGTNNSMSIPSNLLDVASIIAASRSVLKKHTNTRNK